MESLRLSLETYYADGVRAIAEANGIPDAEERTKRELINRLVKEIPRRAGDAATVAALTEAEQATLAVLLAHGGQSTPSEVAVPLALAGLIRLENVQDAANDLPTFESVLHALLHRGFLVNLTPPVGSSTRRRFTPLYEIAIPPEVVRVLSHVELAKPKPRSDLSLMAPPAHIEQRPMSDVLRRLFFVWAELRREPASALNAGGIYKRDARRLAKSLGLPFSEHEEEIRCLVDLLLEMGLLVETIDDVYVEESEDQLRFWSQPIVVQIRRLLSALNDLSPEITFDLSPLNAVRTYAYYTMNPRPIDMLYTDVLELFSGMTENVWFPLDAFLALLNGDKPGTFVLSQESVTTLYRQLRWSGVREHMSARRTRLREALRTVDRQGMEQILARLKELGVVMLGYDEGGGPPIGLQLTPMAHAALTGQPYEDVDATLGQVILQPDFQLLALGPVPLETLSRIEHIAERTKVQPAAVSYRITRESVYRALQLDETLSGILGFLAEVTETPLPQNVARTLREWGAQHERITLREPVLVLQVDRPERLQQLREDACLRELLHPLDATMAWVPSRSALQVEQRLWELEMLPALSRGPDEDLSHSLSWEGGGRLQARHPLPSLYVTGTVQRFAEATDDGWCLTAKSVRSAVSAGLDVPEIVALVEQMTGGALPSTWEKRLKAWGGHYGDAQTARVRLLRFEAPETLTELRASERRLRRRLHPLDGQNGHLAVVEEKHWDDVRTVLEEWGVTVEKSTWW